MRKEIPGFNVPCSDSDSGRDRQKSSFWQDALLNASGVVSTDPVLLKIERDEAQRIAEEKTARRSRKAIKHQNKQEIKKDKQANKLKMFSALIELLIGATTGNPAATAKGVSDAAGSFTDVAKTAQKKKSMKENAKNMLDDIIGG